MLVSTRDRFTSKVRLGRTVVTTIVNAWTPLKVFTVAVTGVQDTEPSLLNATWYRMLTTSVVRNRSVTPQDPGPAVTSKPTAPPMEITLVTNLTLAGLKITVLNSADSVETQPQQVKPRLPLPQGCAPTRFQTAKIMEPSLVADSSLDGPNTTVPRHVDIVEELAPEQWDQEQVQALLQALAPGHQAQVQEHVKILFPIVLSSPGLPV